MRKLKGVGIGACYFAPVQFEAWRRIPEVEIAAISSRTENAARQIMEAYGISRYCSDWRMMLDNQRPDFIDVSTPPETHEEICVFAADRGIHVICQKPLAPTLEESHRVVDYAAAAGTRFMAHESWRWQPWYRAIKRVQAAGTIGAFTHVQVLTRLGDGRPSDADPRQPFFRDYPRFLVYETGVHFIDTFRFLLGEVTQVYAHLRHLNPVVEGEDAGQIVLTFASGATAIWDANRYNEAEADNPRLTFGAMRIDATGGHLTMDLDSRIRIKPLGEKTRDLDYERDRERFGGDCVYHLQRHFVDCLLSGQPFESSANDYLTTIRIVEATYESAASAQAVKIATLP